MSFAYLLRSDDGKEILFRIKKGFNYSTLIEYGFHFKISRINFFIVKEIKKYYPLVLTTRLPLFRRKIIFFCD
jgi:hypothetical protein